ncbi:30S ribosomal protein S7 [Patescibacteria group bacterium]|nr:30S ribosomal protein S7 [Patescibacteria group bacterium]
MRRKRNIEKILLPDPKYQNLLIAKLINHVMKGGKKSVAQRVVYDAFDRLEKEHKVDPLATFDLALKNASPLVEIKARRIGGANYQVPREVKGERKVTLAFRWLLLSARAKTGKPMAAKLAEEIMLASKNEGNAVKKKMDTHRMAEANKAFAHFSW